MDHDPIKIKAAKESNEAPMAIVIPTTVDASTAKKILIESGMWFL